MAARHGRRFPIRSHIVRPITTTGGPPTLSGAATNSAGTQITASLSQSGCTADGGGSSGTGGFTLAGTSATVSSWAISGTALTLTLSGAVTYGQTVTYSYARASTTDDIKNATGNYLADFSGVGVTNNTPDNIPPVLSSPSGTATGMTTANLTVTTNEGNGTLYAVATLISTTPTKAQVKAGQDNTGAAAAFAGSQSISSTGAKTIGATGLAAATVYYAHFMHEDALGNQSTVVSSASFTTNAGLNLHVGTAGGRDYATITAAVAALSTITNPGDVVNIILHNDSVFDESVVFNHGSLNLASLTLTVDAASRHNGTPGSGARIVRSRPTAKTHLLDIRASMTVEWMELDANWSLILDQSQVTVPSTVSGVTVTVRNNLIHGSEHIDPRRAVLFAGGTSTYYFYNNFVFNHHRWGGPTTKSIAVEMSSATSTFHCYNNTIHDVSGLAGGIGILFQDNANNHVKNNLVTYVRTGFGGSGTATCFSPGPSPALADCSNNVSSDATAPGTGSVTNVHFSDCYVSPSAPYDLHLRATGVQAYNVGTALASPTGITTDINGNTRNGTTREWSAGAHSFGSAVSGAATVTLRGPTDGRMASASTNFAVGLDGNYTGTITPASTGNGTFSPTSLTWAGTAETKFFTYTPANTGSRLHNITLSASPSLTVPAALQYRPRGTNAALHRWVSGVTNTGCTVAIRTEADEPNVRINVYAASNLASIVASSAMVASANATNGRVVLLPVTGLTANTHYYGYAEINGVEDRLQEVEFTTAPTPGTAASFTAACGACGAGPYAIVYKLIRQRAPAFFLHAGDIHYNDLNSTTASAYRTNWNGVPVGPYQGELHARVPLAHIWNDHDFCGDASDYNSVGRTAARAAYRENVPNYPLRASGDSPLDYSFVWGRVRIVCVDETSNRNQVAGKSWDAAQMAWFKSELDAAKAAGQVVWWHGQFAYTWTESLSSAERTEIADYLKTISMVGKVIRSGGDAHMLGADNGTNHDFATGTGAPIPQVSTTPLYQLAAIRGGPWSEGTYAPSSVTLQQYGVMAVTDTGSQVTFNFTGYSDNEVSRITLSVVMPLAGTGGGARRRRVLICGSN